MNEHFLGWALAFAVATGTAIALGGRQTTKAVGVAALVTAFPGAWAATQIFPSALTQLPPMAAGALVGGFWHFGVFAFVGIFALALRDPFRHDVRPSSTEPTEPALRPPTTPPAPGAPPPEPLPPPLPPRRPRPKSSLPEIRPAGAVAAGAARGGGSGAEIERAGLLRVMAQGPDFQTSAAAKALAVAWDGTRDRRTLEGLLAVVRRPDVSPAARAEVWIAIRQVAGEPLDWDAQAAARARFPEGLDDDWLDALDADLYAS